MSRNCSAGGVPRAPGAAPPTEGQAGGPLTRLDTDARRTKRDGEEVMSTKQTAAAAQQGERQDGAKERVVVMGGTSGIGLAPAERELREGREVIVTGRDKGRLDAALERLGEGATGASVDAGDQEAVQEFFASIG